MKNTITKAIAASLAIFPSAQVLGQSSSASQVIASSKDMFRWEVEGKFDSVANLFHDKLVVVGSSGTTRGKNEYMADLKAGKPLHNSITVEEATATVAGTTVAVTGKGLFDVTVSDTKTTLRLSYMEVFVKQGKAWKMIALYASRLAN